MTDQQNADRLAEILERALSRAHHMGLSSTAITVALLGAAIRSALAAHPNREAVANWLHGVADAIAAGDDALPDTKH